MAIRFLALFLLAAMAAIVHAEVPAPLDQAVKKLVADTDRWAYSQEVREFDKNGKSDGGPTRERYDPSKPEDEQWTLQLYRGRIPTEADVRAWQRQKRREAKRRDRPLGEIIDFERAVLTEETELGWVYRLPIKPGASRRLPSDKFFVLMSVGKARMELENVSVRTTESFRLNGLAGLAAKVEGVEVDARFAVVDDAYAAQPSVITASGSARVAWVFRVGGRAEVVWTEFQRVKPYRDRYDVQIGDVKALDF
jgi:hypothetical protein